MSRSIMRAQVLALLAVLLVASSAAQALAVSVLARTAPALAALQDEGDEEDPDQAQADEAESADEAQSEDGAEVEEAVSDEEEPAEEGEPAEEEESVDESEPADATEPAAAAAEEPAASTPAPEPATGQPKADVERWSVTINSPMGVINLELAIEKSSGGAVVSKIWGDGVTGQSVPVEIAGDKLSWSWDVTNPMPMRFNCDSTIQGDQMSGNCKLGMFGNAAMFGSRK